MVARVRRIQDPVHGLMEFQGLEGAVVDVLSTPELQRLRKVRQLGLAQLVFPGAEHSRLSHSIGAAYVGIRFIRHLSHHAEAILPPSLAPDEETVRDVALAALCHDLGHGPLSHAWEREVVGEDWDRRKWAEALGVSLTTDELTAASWHELVGHAFLNWEEGQLYKKLNARERGLPERIGQLLRGSYQVPYVPRLLSSDVDVDRADFIRRDALCTGIAYGRFDLNWLVSTSTIGYVQESQGKRWEIGFDEKKGQRIVEQFLIARRAMYETVYYHKTVRCAEGMMGNLLRRMKETSKDGSVVFRDLPNIVQPIVDIFHGKALRQDQLLMLDDFSLSVLIDHVANKHPDKTAQELARRIRDRDLFRLVPIGTAELDSYFRSDSDSHHRLYEAIRQYVPENPEYFIVKDTYRFRMFSNDSKSAYLVDESGKCITLQNYYSLKEDEAKKFRLFSVKEAIPDIVKCIRSTHG